MQLRFWSTSILSSFKFFVPLAPSFIKDSALWCCFWLEYDNTKILDVHVPAINAAFSPKSLLFADVTKNQALVRECFNLSPVNAAASWITSAEYFDYTNLTF